jgi:hypothetical protein
MATQSRGHGTKHKHITRKYSYMQLLRPSSAARIVTYN